MQPSGPGVSIHKLERSIVKEYETKPKEARGCEEGT